MIKDKEVKKGILKQILKALAGAKKPDEMEEEGEEKATLVIKAEADTPEEAKKAILEKLPKLPMGEKEDKEEEDEDEDFMSELPEFMKKKLLKK
jgi:hypothetical protein